MSNPFEELSLRLDNIEKTQSEILSLLRNANPPKKLLTKREYAKAIKKSLPTIDRWVSSGKLTPTIIGSCRYFEEPSVN